MKVSIDFDGTLDQEMVQIYAQDLVNRGTEVWICTFRYDDKHKEMQHPHLDNQKLYKIADKVGIKKDHIIFTNYQNKWRFLKGKGFIWHLDDDPNMLKDIEEFTNVTGVYMHDPTWMGKCERLLND